MGNEGGTKNILTLLNKHQKTLTDKKCFLFFEDTNFCKIVSYNKTFYV